MSNTSKTYTVAKEITFKKSGVVIPVGEKISLTFQRDGEHGLFTMIIKYNDQEFKVRNYRIFNYLKGVRIPSEKTLWKWSEDGVCKSVFGHKIEPDGVDHQGSPSWLLLIGLI